MITITEKTTALEAKERSLGLRINSTIEVEKFETIKGYCDLKDAIKFLDVDLTGVKQRRLVARIKALCSYNRYFTKKYIVVKYAKAELIAFFDKYDNGALVEITKDVVKEKVPPRAQKVKPVIINTDEKRVLMNALNKLDKGVIDFVYQKENGEIRSAKGTRFIDLVPSGIEENSRIVDNENTIKYFDIGKGEWRSFKKELFLNITKREITYIERSDNVDSSGLTEAEKEECFGYEEEKKKRRAIMEENVHFDCLD